MTSVSSNYAAFQGLLGPNSAGSRTSKTAAEEEYSKFLDKMAGMVEEKSKQQGVQQGSTADAPAIPAMAGASNPGFQAQQIAQQMDAQQMDEEAAEATGAVGEEEPESESAAVRAFLEYMSKTPEERYFDAFLKSKGMTQEEFDALPVEEKQALMQEFQETIKQRVENDTTEKLAKAGSSAWL